MSGLLVLVVGPMFSGKTEKIIDYYYKLRGEGKNVLVFKPVIDNRYNEKKIVSHNGREITAIPIESIQELNSYLQSGNQTILIDEIQLFFSEEVINFLDDLTKKEKEIIITGLDWDNFKNAPVPSVAGLLAAADEVIKLTGICDICGEKATRTQWKMDFLPQKPSDYVGGVEKYGCRCKLHYIQPQNINKFVLVLISGSSGVGKSEIVKRLLTYQELSCQQLINITTRPPRNGEIDGKDYYFVSREEFQKKLADNQFLDYVEYNNNYYGTPLNSLEEGLLTKNILQIVNIQGFRNIKKVWKKKIISFWLQPPHRNKLLSNLKKRGDKEEEIIKRLAIAEEEVPFANEYDYIFTVNDNLDQVAEEIKKIILLSIGQQQYQTQIEVLPKK